MNTKKLLAMLTGCVMSASMLAGMPVSAAEYGTGRCGYGWLYYRA